MLQYHIYQYLIEMIFNNENKNSYFAENKNMIFNKIGEHDQV